MTFFFNLSLSSPPSARLLPGARSAGAGSSLSRDPSRHPHRQWVPPALGDRPLSPRPPGLEWPSAGGHARIAGRRPAAHRLARRSVLVGAVRGEHLLSAVLHGISAVRPELFRQVRVPRYPRRPCRPGLWPSHRLSQQRDPERHPLCLGSPPAAAEASILARFRLEPKRLIPD